MKTRIRILQIILVMTLVLFGLIGCTTDQKDPTTDEVKDGTIKNNTLNFTKNFLDNCDLYGYVPMFWDCSSFFIRSDLKIHDEGLANLFFERSLLAQAGLTEDDVRANAREALDSSIAIAIENDAARVDDGPVLNGDEDAIAWIMFNSNDYSLTYSVGDLYSPTTNCDGIVATDAQIEGPGTYTVG